MQKNIPSHDGIDPVRGQVVAKKVVEIVINMIIVAIRVSELRETFMKTSMRTTMIIHPGRTVAIVSPAEIMMTVEVDIHLSIILQTITMIKMDGHQMDITRTLATPTIVGAANPFLIAREMNLHLIHAPILAMAPHPETFEGEADHI